MLIKYFKEKELDFELKLFHELALSTQVLHQDQYKWITYVLSYIAEQLLKKRREIRPFNLPLEVCSSSLSFTIPD